MKLAIAGAGLAGLITAHAVPAAPLFEPATVPLQTHKAVLRFRSEAVAALTGIEFRPVTVHKGIWYDERFVEPNILLANLYSRKVTGAVSGDRSIWNTAPVTRYIAPESFYEQLIAAVAPRIRWGEPYAYAAENGPVISTAPLPVVLGALGMPVTGFVRSPIHVLRARVSGCSNVYQTIYFPEDWSPVFRASITGDLLIVEAMNSITPEHLAEAVRPFGVSGVTVIDEGTQRYGKIIPMEPLARRALLHKLTTEHGIFSVGRFATWRNVLLDDVVQDIAVIRKLLRASRYEQFLFAAK